jgi:putative addiction module component (TIGR02574 family)
MSIDDLEAEVKKLSLRERAALARRIVESLDELSEQEIEALWIEEAERRLDELEQGQVTEVSAEEVIRRARIESESSRSPTRSGGRSTGADVRAAPELCCGD